MAKLKIKKTFAPGDIIEQDNTTIIITGTTKDPVYSYYGYQIPNDNKKAIEEAKAHIETYKRVQQSIDKGEFSFRPGQPLKCHNKKFTPMLGMGWTNNE